MKDLEVLGVILKVASRYVCWDSFKAKFYLGGKENSEIFCEFAMIDFIYNINNHKLSKRAYLALSLFPIAKRVYVTED